jgi:Domain of unknown function (DUF4416)
MDMGHANPPAPALLIFAAISRHEAALTSAKKSIESHIGPIVRTSPAFDFTETDYYLATMGADLKKQFFACERLIDPAQLVDLKLQTNSWEEEFAAQGRFPEPRPLNLDPGYITLAKLVLASTKDHSHRLYLGQGIYGEITLSFRGGRWQETQFTYPDYRRADFHEFFIACREYLKEHGGK